MHELKMQVMKMADQTATKLQDTNLHMKLYDHLVWKY